MTVVDPARSMLKAVSMLKPHPKHFVGQLFGLSDLVSFLSDNLSPSMICREVGHELVEFAFVTRAPVSQNFRIQELLLETHGKIC